MKRNIIAWIAQILMGILYLMASYGKVTSMPEVIIMFDNWGYPPGFYLIIGGIELLGGLLLFYPKSSGYAALMLMVVMAGAAFTHVSNDEGFVVLKPLGYMIGLGVVFYIRFLLEMKNDDAAYFPLNEGAEIPKI